MANLMRAFVAVEIPNEVRRHLSAGLEPLESVSGLSVVKPQRMHVTLAFLGDVTQQTIDDVRNRLARTAGRTRPFSLETGQLRRFGNRVLYLSLSGDTDHLKRLATAVAAAARRAGAQMSDEVFRPHITIARARTRLDLRGLASSIAPPEPRSWDVTSCTLVRSHLGPDPRYEPVPAFPFAATTLHA
jgi:2'-5' RNA ligase